MIKHFFRYDDILIRAIFLYMKPILCFLYLYGYTLFKKMPLICSSFPGFGLFSVKQL